MYGLEVVIGMTVIRIIVPLIVLLSIGELAGRQGRRRYGER